MVTPSLQCCPSAALHFCFTIVHLVEFHHKSYVNRFLNEGNYVMSAEQVKKALESHGNVVPYVVNYPESTSRSPVRHTPDISLLHNYQYCDEGLKVWKAYNIGSGKVVAWENLDKDGKILPLEQGENECVKEDNTCLAAGTPGLVQPESSPK